MFDILQTRRLILRPPRARDIGRFLPLIRDFDIAKNLSGVPHPYTEDDACDFMIKASVGWMTETGFAFSVRRKTDEEFIGICGVRPAAGWELGYWVGKPYWGRGYATEMAARMLAFGFDEKGAERITAAWFHDNGASGRVLEKVGFRPAGLETRSCLARGYDVPAYAVALDRHAYRARKNAP
jgi:RimJ/RimL family protein N-acetyltransferase